MSNHQKVKSTFLKHGYNAHSSLRRAQFQNFLNSLVTGEIYTPQLSSQLWDQAAQGRQEVVVQQLWQTIFDAQKIVQNKLFELNDDIKAMHKQAKGLQTANNHQGYSELMTQIQEIEEEKQSFEDDLMLLTEPFGINMLAFMANAAKMRKISSIPQEDFSQRLSDNPENSETQLKWLFYLCLIFALIEVIVIFKKYDFLNLMVLSCLLFIFFMNQLESNYVKFTLALLTVSEVLDIIWLFMNSSDYWNPPKEGVNSQAELGYLRLIVALTFLGVFLKIPLGIFLYHYRKVQEGREYKVDLGFAKMDLKVNKMNPITEGIKKMEILT